MHETHIVKTSFAIVTTTDNHKNGYKNNQNMANSGNHNGVVKTYKLIAKVQMLMTNSINNCVKVIVVVTARNIESSTKNMITTIAKMTAKIAKITKKTCPYMLAHVHDMSNTGVIDTMRRIVNTQLYGN